MTPPTTDTSREAVERNPEAHGDGFDAGSGEYFVFWEKHTTLLAERDALRDQLAAARNEALDEVEAKTPKLYSVYGGDRTDPYAKGYCAGVENYLDIIRAIKPTTPAPRHPDDAAVDRFAEAMKAKLATKRADGRGGWDNKKVCSQALLSDLLRGHVDKGDPVDVANFSMMLHQRGEAIMSATREDCPECKGSGMRDSGGVQPWGEPIDVPCDCENAPREVTVQEE